MGVARFGWLLLAALAAVSGVEGCFGGGPKPNQIRFSCGVNDLPQKIVGGQDAQPNSIPWQG